MSRGKCAKQQVKDLTNGKFRKKATKTFLKEARMMERKPEKKEERGQSGKGGGRLDASKNQPKYLKH